MIFFRILLFIIGQLIELALILGVIGAVLLAVMMLFVT